MKESRVEAAIRDQKEKGKTRLHVWKIFRADQETQLRFGHISGTEFSAAMRVIDDVLDRVYE